MIIKKYCAGYYISANNTVTVWTIYDHVFFELNSKGWKYQIAENFEDIIKEKFIFEEYFLPEVNFPDEIEEIQTELENERIINKINLFLQNLVKMKKHKYH